MPKFHEPYSGQLCFFSHSVSSFAASCAPRQSPGSSRTTLPDLIRSRACFTACLLSFTDMHPECADRTRGDPSLRLLTPGVHRTPNRECGFRQVVNGLTSASRVRLGGIMSPRHRREPEPP